MQKHWIQLSQRQQIISSSYTLKSRFKMLSCLRKWSTGLSKSFVLVNTYAALANIIMI